MSKHSRLQGMRIKVKDLSVELAVNFILSQATTRAVKGSRFIFTANICKELLLINYLFVGK